MYKSTFKPRTKPMKRGTSTLKSSGKRIKTGRSTTNPTIEEQAWMNFLVEFGCVICWMQHKARTPCAVHHIVEGSRRLGHLFTIGLCDPGHHQGSPDHDLKISRHPNKARFEAAYGTEYELLAYLQEKFSTLRIKPL